jgi:hypothetical protein
MNDRTAPYTVLVIFLKYDPEKYRASVRGLRELFGKCPNGRFTFLIVDNRTPGTPARVATPDEIEIGGDNSSREFSGWNRGIAYALNALPRFDIVAFVNDTYPLNQHEYAHALSDDCLQMAIRLQLVLGLVYAVNKHKGAWRYITHSPERYELLGDHFNYWLRSNLVILPYELCARVKWPTLAIDRFFPPLLSPAVFRAEAPLSENLKRKVKNYLCPESGYRPDKFVWHSCFRLDQGTYRTFKEKAICILDEMSFAPVLIHCGATIADLRLVGHAVKCGCFGNPMVRGYLLINQLWHDAQAVIMFLYDRMARHCFHPVRPLFDVMSTQKP